MASKEWQSLSDMERSLLLDHQMEAPIKVSAIAKALGLTVKASTLPAGISGEIRPDPQNPGQFIVKVNRHDSAGRQRFTVAHEVSHFLLHKTQIGDGIEDDALYRSTLSDKREAEANRLAADILMPAELLDRWISQARAIGAPDIVNYLSERFQVSEAAMRIRLGLD